MKKLTPLWVTRKTRDKVNLIKYQEGFKSQDEVIRKTLDKNFSHEKKKKGGFKFDF